MELNYELRLLARRSMRLATSAVVGSLIACQPTRWAAMPRGAVTMQMDFVKKAQESMGGLKMPGMPGGDDMGLSKEQAEEMEARMKTGGMSFDDFLMQTKVMQKAGSMQAMMQKMPFGGGGQISDQQLQDGERKMKRFGSYIEVMAAEERNNPQLLLDELKGTKSGVEPERMQRIADASGAELSQVANFVSEFSSLRSAAQKFANGANPEDIKREMMEEREETGTVNRAQRRAAKKKKAGAVKARPGGFGR